MLRDISPTLTSILFSWVWETAYCSNTVMPYITKKQSTDWQKDAPSPFPKKGHLGMPKNYRIINLTYIVLYYAIALSPKLKRYLGTTKMAFWEIDQQHQISLFASNSRRCMYRKPRSNNITCRLLQGFWKREQTLLTNGLLQKRRRSHNDAIYYTKVKIR